MCSALPMLFHLLSQILSTFPKDLPLDAGTKQRTNQQAYSHAHARPHHKWSLPSFTFPSTVNRYSGAPHITWAGDPRSSRSGSSAAESRKGSSNHCSPLRKLHGPQHRSWRQKKRTVVWLTQSAKGVDVISDLKRVRLEYKAGHEY